MTEVRARTYTDLKDISFSQRDDLVANFMNGWRISQHLHQKGIDMISIKRHWQSAIVLCRPTPTMSRTGTRCQSRTDFHRVGAIVLVGKVLRDMICGSEDLELTRYEKKIVRLAPGSKY